MRTLTVKSRAVAEAVLKEIGVDPVGIACMVPKMRHLNVRIRDVECRAANIIKQDMLSAGGDAAVARGSVACSMPVTDVLLMGTLKQLRHASEKFRRQPFGLPLLAQSLDGLLNNIDKDQFILRCKKGELKLSERTHIMGILNVTPDSFSDGARYDDVEAACDRALKMVDEGADIIDVGGESTRPGARPVSLEEEMKRVLPVVEGIARRSNVPISIDTYKAKVAEKALGAGADIINDISGFRFDAGMAEVAGRVSCPVVLMHIKGRPGDMQADPAYDSLMDEVIGYLQEGMEIAEKGGVDPENIIVDPGIGFGKRFEDNLSLINDLDELKVLGKAILVGPSRKSFIGHILGEGPPEERMEGTLAASVMAAVKGAHIVRIHDVGAARKALAVADAVIGSR